MTSWTRLTLPFSVALLLAGCSPLPDEVASTSGVDPSTSTSAGPGPTTPGTTMPGEDTVGTVGVTGTDTTMGAVDTTVGVSVTDETTIDPSSDSTISSGVGSSSTGPVECEAPCPNNEICNAMGECESVCAASGWGPNDYSYCVTPLGGFDSMTICGEAMTCIVSSNGIGDFDTAVCGRSCATPCDCPAPAATGDATVTCGDIVGEGASQCYLSCANGETCPDDMTCLTDGMGNPVYCSHPVQPIETYGNCDNFAAGCVDGDVCATSDDNSVCVTPCFNVGECDPALPGSDFGLDCGGVIYPPDGSECHMNCNINTDCPDGMVCIDTDVMFTSTLCMWP